jgi:hypothetical protein
VKEVNYNYHSERSNSVSHVSGKEAPWSRLHSNEPLLQPLARTRSRTQNTKQHTPAHYRNDLLEHEHIELRQIKVTDHPDQRQRVTPFTLGQQIIKQSLSAANTLRGPDPRICTRPYRIPLSVSWFLIGIIAKEYRHNQRLFFEIGVFGCQGR